MISKPRIFISYSREDFKFATAIKESLLKKNYVVFFDEESIEIGDVFPKRIVSELKKTDGIIIIVSDFSIKSEWCKLESYYAHFYKKTIIPLKLKGIENEKDFPLNYIEKDINYYLVEDPSNSEKALIKIENKLKDIRKKAFQRVFKLITYALIITAGLSLIVYYGINNINSIKYNNDRKELISQIKSAEKILTSSEIDFIKSKFNNDDEVLSQLYLIQVNSKDSDMARMNAKILSGYIPTSYKLSSPFKVENLEWSNSKMENNYLNNIIVKQGHLNDVTLSKINLDNVSFYGNSESKGVIFSKVKFSKCFFNTVNFYSNQASDVTFTACKFNNVILNTTNFFKVKFLSLPPEDGSDIDLNKFTSFKDCIISNSNPVEPEVDLNFAQDYMVSFQDINFYDCRFDGLVRAEWFKNCGFYNCSFTSESSKIELSKSNHVE